MLKNDNTSKLNFAFSQTTFNIMLLDKKNIQRKNKKQKKKILLTEEK